MFSPYKTFNQNSAHQEIINSYLNYPSSSYRKKEFSSVKITVA